MYSWTKSVNKRPYERIFNKCSEYIYFVIQSHVSKRHDQKAGCLHLFITLQALQVRATLGVSRLERHPLDARHRELSVIVWYTIAFDFDIKFLIKAKEISCLLKRAKKQV